MIADDLRKVKLHDLRKVKLHDRNSTAKMSMSKKSCERLWDQLRESCVLDKPARRPVGEMKFMGIQVEENALVPDNRCVLLNSKNEVLGVLDIGDEE